MVHRALFGSVERFMGIITEHYGGAFPTWLAPVQVAVLPVSQDVMDYARSVTRSLEEAGIRVELDGREEKIGYKIREAEVSKVPYMLVLGAREAESGAVSVRAHSQGDLGTRPLAEFVKDVIDESAVDA
jgi:threonyl-tRNA synthetase